MRIILATLALSSYMSDVVLALTARGEIDEAYRFVQRRLQWFVIYVDTSSSVAYSDIRQGFNSQMVRERLSRLIEETY